MATIDCPFGRGFECHVICRTHAGANNTARPSWFSKELCLRSLIHALQRLSAYCPADLIVLHDGPTEPASDWDRQLTPLVERHGRLIELSKRGNAASYLESVRRGALAPPQHLIVIAEDDYLWLPESLIELAWAIAHLPADYLTAYDHADRYKPSSRDAERAHWHSVIHALHRRHWRSHESTCLTFCARAGTLREDLALIERYAGDRRGDRELFLALQHLRDASLGPPRRLLLGPIPSLAAHASLLHLPPCVDWTEAAGRLASLTAAL